MNFLLIFAAVWLANMFVVLIFEYSQFSVFVCVCVCLCRRTYRLSYGKWHDRLLCFSLLRNVNKYLNREEKILLVENGHLHVWHRVIDPLFVWLERFPGGLFEKNRSKWVLDGVKKLVSFMCFMILENNGEPRTN